LLWAFGAVGGKIMAIHSGAVLFLLSVFCTFVTFQVGSRLSTGRWVAVSPRELIAPIGIVSSLGYGWYWLFYGASFRHTPVAALSAALNYTWPLFTAVFSSIAFSSGESAGHPAQKAVRLFGMMLGAVAVSLVLFSCGTGSLTGLPWLGIVFGLAAGAAYGFYSAYSGTIAAEDQFRFLVLSSLSGMIVLLPFALPELSSLQNVPGSSFAVTILFGIFMDGVGYFVWTRAVAEARRQTIPIEKVTSIIYVLPVLSVLITQSMFPAAEVHVLLGLAGIALLTCSSFFCQRPEIVLRVLRRFRGGGS
jgi:drug/metabolite transporter (DMT)-like permease